MKLKSLWKSRLTPRRRNSKPKAARQRPPVNWFALRRAAVVVGCIGVVAGLGAGWAYGVPRLKDYASAASVAGSDAEFAPLQIDFIDLPAWVTPELQTRLELTVREHITSDPMSQRDLAQARESLLATGWFEEIEQLRRASAAGGLGEVIEVRARPVDPFALIRDQFGDHLVDRQGKLLPQSFQRGTKTSIPVIVGARFLRPSRPLQSWEGEDVSAALRVLRLIEDHAWRDQVVSVDVSEYLAKNRELLQLNTDRASWILWGRAPGDERAAEVPAAQKLSYLDFHFRQCGHIDKNHPREVDVRLDRVVLR